MFLVYIFLKILIIVKHLQLALFFFFGFSSFQDDNMRDVIKMITQREGPSCD